METVVARAGPTADGSEGGTNETSDLSPGEQLSGAIAVRAAEVDGGVELRAFEASLRDGDAA